MKIDKGFFAYIGVSDLPALPDGDTYHVCLYNPATGKEFAAQLASDVPASLAGDVHYEWTATTTLSMEEGKYDLKIYDANRKVLFGCERFADVNDPHIEACEED